MRRLQKVIVFSSGVAHGCPAATIPDKVNKVMLSSGERRLQPGLKETGGGLRLSRT